MPSSLPSSPPPSSPAHSVLSTPSEERAGAILTIDLAAIAANYRLLTARLGTAACGAVVKADAYGLDAAVVAPVLFDAGCRDFFVAHIEEGIALRQVLPDSASVVVMHGLFAGCERDCLAHGLTPVLNTRGQLARWAALGRDVAKKLPACIQVDSGMSRFGLSDDDIDAIVAQAGDLAAIDLRLVMSHLACSDSPDDPFNERQRAAFEAMRARLPEAPASLVASSGSFLPARFHFDLARPGAALYGVAPVPGETNPLHPVVRLDAKVMQLRDVPAGTMVGYGCAGKTTAAARLATVAIGYADGYFRAGGNRGQAWFGDIPLPVIGRVSMDSVVLDVSGVPHDALDEGMLVEIIGPHRDIDAIAADLQTTGYEILTSLGRRYHRRHVSNDTRVARECFA